jgi:GDP-mannose transporter
VIAKVIVVFLNLATLWCVSNNSATTYAVVGALNKIPLAVVG